MSSTAIDASDIPTKTSSFKPDELQYRTAELKQSLIIWRNILLPLNNLLEWEHKYDPLIIFGILSFIFMFIRQINPPVLTFISCMVLIIILADLFAPLGLGILYKNKNWTSMNDEKYSRLCEHIAHLEQHIKHQCQSALKIRQERPMMYLMIGGIFLSFLAFCGQRIDNLFLTYLTTLIISLIPGVCNRQLIPIIGQYWNKSKNQ